MRLNIMLNKIDGQFLGEIDNNFRSRNNQILKENDDCQKSIDKLKQLEKFLSNMGFLSFGRDYIVCNKTIFSLQIVITSLELTMGSIISCCENACIADANTLMRKYRDDLFFYLYILMYDSLLKLGNTTEASKKMERMITHWSRNELKNFNIGQVLQGIENADHLKSAVEMYDLKKSFDEIGKHLNNYVHGNGHKFYNKNVNAYSFAELAIEYKNIVENAKYITIVFLFLLTLCAPHLIMSEDYINYLDFNETPPEGSQYWVAPFIQQFIKSNISMIDENCIDYLKSTSLMQFE